MLGNPPTTLIYDRKETSNISVIGAFPEPIPKDSSPPVFRFPNPEYYPFTSQAVRAITNYSFASLQDVVLAKVFHREGRSSCRGLIFTYRNGAQRALGDCRLGVDPCQTYTDPRFLRIFVGLDRLTYAMRDLHLVKVRFSADSAQNDEEGGWSCYEMKATLQFWFTHEECKIKVVSY